MTGNVAGRVGTTSAIKKIETFSNETHWIRNVLFYKVRIRTVFRFRLSDLTPSHVKVRVS